MRVENDCEFLINVLDPPDVSVVIPVYNEGQNLEELCGRLLKTMDGMSISYEVIFIDDGSTDGSADILRRCCDDKPGVVLVELNRNYGQHAAVFAGFQYASGEVIVTLDADLQNPPEEIPKLLNKVKEGYDVVGTRRIMRHDPLLRKLASWGMNRLMRPVLGAELRDYGCMLRAYRREIVEAMRQCGEISTFIPALAMTYARRVTEVDVQHAERRAGQSKYSLLRLIRLQFDLVTGFSMLPIRLMSLLGVVTSVAGMGFGIFLFIRRLHVGPEAEGVFTLFAILFVFVGLLFLAMGLLGEYVGRIYLEVRGRPRYLIRNVYRTQTCDQPSNTAGNGRPDHKL